MARQKQRKSQEQPRRTQRKRPNYKTLVVEDGSYKTNLTEKYLKRKVHQEKDIRNVESFIPGKIVKIMVSEGQAVTRGDSLLILEAMKMNNRIMAPMDGVIKKIFIKENERIPKNHLLLTLE
jgi:pyruvate carboxylase subunit B